MLTLRGHLQRHADQKLGWILPERPRNPNQIVHVRIAQSAFDLADRSPIDLSGCRQLLLGQVEFEPEGSDPLPKFLSCRGKRICHASWISVDGTPNQGVNILDQFAYGVFAS